MTPIASLEKSENKASLLLDKEIIHKFISILNDSKKEASKLFCNQLQLHILKCLSSMIKAEEGSFLNKLKDEGLLEVFVQHLYKRQSEEKSKSDLIPVEWLELKCCEIKKKALENDVSLIQAGKNELTAQVMNKKQIIVNSHD